MSVNKAIIIGRVGRAPELNQTNSGGAVANFTLASNEVFTDKTGARQEKTEWHRVVAYNKLGEIAHKYLTKGSQVYIEGRIQTREWNDKDGNKRYSTEVVASEMKFLGTKSSSASGDEPTPNGFEQPFDSDDIPF